MTFICPVCGEELLRLDGVYKCKNKHCYDCAKSGYVNLLPPSVRGHGDSREMVRARRDFLDLGYYKPLSDAISAAACKYTPQDAQILDAGCGECYYTFGVKEYFDANGKSASFSGIDVSKDAVNYGAKRFHGAAALAAASVYAMPFADGCADLILSVFAPAATEEFLRVLKSNGILIMAIGAENHLWSLKKAVYDTPYKNTMSDYALGGFELIENIPINYEIDLNSNEAIKNLFRMTPYYHKTSQSDFARLDAYENLTTEIAFEILIYRKA